MGLRFKYKEATWEKLADGCRKASWGFGPLSAFIGSYYGAGWALVAGAVSWFLLQLAGFLIGSVSSDIASIDEGFVA